MRGLGRRRRCRRRFVGRVGRHATALGERLGVGTGLDRVVVDERGAGQLYRGEVGANTYYQQLVLCVRG